MTPASAGRPTVGLALGGGGARGYAHLGVLRVLQREGIPVDVLAGTSMGAVVGGAYAAGLDLEKLQRLLRRLDLHRLLGFPRSSLRGLLTNAAGDVLGRRRDWRRHEPDTTRTLVEFFRLFTQGKTFDELSVPLGVTAVDIDSGEGLVLEEGPLDRALAAAVALPGIHYPVAHQGRYLVDGGLINNLPIDVAAAMGAEVVVAVDVEAPLWDRPGATSMDVLLRAEAIVLRELHRLRMAEHTRQLGDRLIVLHPPLAGVGTLELETLDRPIQVGEAEASRRLPEIRRRLTSGPNAG